MKMHFNVVLDEREDGTKVWSAKCLRCDAVLVGEQATPIPVVRANEYLPPNTIPAVARQVLKQWDIARKTGNPVLLLDPRIEIETVPDHGLQRALTAHTEACSKEQT